MFDQLYSRHFDFKQEQQHQSNLSTCSSRVPSSLLIYNWDTIGKHSIFSFLRCYSYIEHLPAAANDTNKLSSSSMLLFSHPQSRFAYAWEWLNQAAPLIHSCRWWYNSTSVSSQLKPSTSQKTQGFYQWRGQRSNTEKCSFERLLQCIGDFDPNLESHWRTSAISC